MPSSKMVSASSSSVSSTSHAALRRKSSAVRSQQRGMATARRALGDGVGRLAAVPSVDAGGRHRRSVRARGIGKEVMLAGAAPDTLLKEKDSDGAAMRERFERMIRDAQKDITASIEELEGGDVRFREDVWTREEGGGGITKVLQGGKVFEKAGVNISVVYGSMPPEAYRAATGQKAQSDGANGTEKELGRVPFFAAGISSVMHPHNPMAPTMHFNYRYFETDEWNGLPAQWWFGGGTDLTPSYIFEDDVRHFHQVYKDVCDRHDPEYYSRFKKWCDEYFVIKHRGETRGVGGIFFDDLNDRPADEIFAFSKDCANAVVESYVPLVARHKDDAFTSEEKDWQQLRRGRYVEFNLVYDRGTTFGLKTGGRIESILMSLPLTSRWEYDHEPEEGSREARLLRATRNAEDWLGLLQK